MRGQDSAAAAKGEKTIDSGFFSDEIETSKPKRRGRNQVPRRRVHLSKQAGRVLSSEDGLATPTRGGKWRETRSPLSDSTYDQSRNEQLHSPSVRLGKRADHDVCARLGTLADPSTAQRGPFIVERPSSAQDPAPLNRSFLREYNKARLGSEDGVPSREEIVRLLRKYPSVNDQTLVATLLQDIVDLKADLEQVKEGNQALRQENCLLMEMAEET